MRHHVLSSAAAFAAAIASIGAAAEVAIAAGPTPAPATVSPSVPAHQPAKTKPKTNPTAPGAIKGSTRLFLRDAFFVHRRAVTVPGRLMHISGVVRPYVAGQWVEVKTLQGRRVIKADRLRIKPAGHGSYGTFTEKVRSPGTGVIVIKAVHARTSQMLRFLAQRGVACIAEHAAFGSRGTFVALVQQRLAALHFYIPQTGVYDQKTGLAIDAYHRLLGRGTSQRLDPGTIAALLNGAGAFKVRFPHDGTHVEGNMRMQLLALINGSTVYAIYPISSGKPSTPTILGHFHVYQRTPGYLPDGMYYSDFFYGGYAIHGYDPAPDYPASHGCMRLPIVDAISVFNWLSYGDTVD